MLPAAYLMLDSLRMNTIFLLCSLATRRIAGGKVTPRIDRRYRLEEVVQALRWVEDGHARGKVVITVADA